MDHVSRCMTNIPPWQIKLKYGNLESGLTDSDQIIRELKPQINLVIYYC
jgi:hypothetical protein